MRYGVFIGRFQPLHLGHCSVLEQAAQQVDTLIILVGSANRARSLTNPWTYEERARNISDTLALPNIVLAPLNDYRYDDSTWLSDVEYTVRAVIRGTGQYERNVTITLFGHGKEGNDYLKWFPLWEYINLDSKVDISATQVRQFMLEYTPEKVPTSVVEDAEYFAREKELFANYPYPGTLNFNCADAVLVWEDSVLLIKRKSAPGRGNWALPGGFKNSNETFLDCAIRERIEETEINLTAEVLLSTVEETKLFDSPTRGRGIPRNTVAVLMDLCALSMDEAPSVTARDDASEVAWVAFSELGSGEYVLHDDHLDIIHSMVGCYIEPAYKG